MGPAQSKTSQEREAEAETKRIAAETKLVQTKSEMRIREEKNRAEIAEKRRKAQEADKEKRRAAIAEEMRIKNKQQQDHAITLKKIALEAEEIREREAAEQRAMLERKREAELQEKREKREAEIRDKHEAREAEAARHRAEQEQSERQRAAKIEETRERCRLLKLQKEETEARENKEKRDRQREGMKNRRAARRANREQADLTTAADKVEIEELKKQFREKVRSDDPQASALFLNSKPVCLDCDEKDNEEPFLAGDHEDDDAPQQPSQMIIAQEVENEKLAESKTNRLKDVFAVIDGGSDFAFTAKKELMKQDSDWMSSMLRVLMKRDKNQRIAATLGTAEATDGGLVDLLDEDLFLYQFIMKNHITPDEEAAGIKMGPGRQLNIRIDRHFGEGIRGNEMKARDVAEEYVEGTINWQTSGYDKNMTIDNTGTSVTSYSRAFVVKKAKDDDRVYIYRRVATARLTKYIKQAQSVPKEVD